MTTWMKTAMWIGGIWLFLVLSIVWTYRNTRYNRGGDLNKYHNLDEAISKLIEVRQRIKYEQFVLSGYQAEENKIQQEIYEYCASKGLYCNTDKIGEPQVEETIPTGALGDMNWDPIASMYIPWGKPLPPVYGNTAQKRFENFSKYYDVDPGVFVEARNAYWVAEELTMCIAWAETTLGQANKSSNNIMNYWNNDRWDTRSYTGIRDNVIATTWWMTQWLLSKNNILWELSNHGREVLGLPTCETPGEFCYATSDSNGFWRNNVYDCLTFIHNEKKDWDNYRFKNDLVANNK